MGITIKDVARHANVAISTASRAINGSGYVSEKTCDRVNEAIRELGYRPNSIARSLKQKCTYSIGLVVTDIGNPFFAEVAQAVERAAREKGYSVLLVSTDGSPEQETAGVEVLIAKQVDGIIWFAPLNKSLISNLSSAGTMRVVIISGIANSLGIHSVYINDQLGALEAVSHLIRLGHTRIGYIAEPEGPQHSQERLFGYMAALKNAGIPLDASLIVRGNYQEGSGLRAVKKLLSLGQNPTAIFSANDLMAIEAMQFIRGMGLRVPEDIALVGFDDIKLAGLYGIDLTTVAQPKYDMGREATKLLISSFRQERTSRQILFRPSLVIRKSCGGGLDQKETGS